MAKPKKGPAKVRTITDQVELIDWLVEQVKADGQEMIGIGTVRCFDAIAQEFRYGVLPDLTGVWPDYLDAVFGNLTNQDEKILCSRNVGWLASDALAHLIEEGRGRGLAADYFVLALARALKLQAELPVACVGKISHVTSTMRFQTKFGFRCNVRIQRFRHTELYRQEVGL
ncbi:MAG: hypothetical protein EOR00_24285 [Mesorhizobium sp.]|uniref:hypothetical protein n=1 Tax=Mesorhizobium sp. TaxID=1871066 RepID=UPI000FE4D20F|nr:hypothetical protein [Mesorhizobium sp.]RWP13961.1 MAG: hypothetical protein EOR00_24285 [Mesorhizobium sp.]